MNERPLRATVIDSYPFPSWLEFASQHLDQFGAGAGRPAERLAYRPGAAPHQWP